MTHPLCEPRSGVSHSGLNCLRDAIAKHFILVVATILLCSPCGVTVHCLDAPSNALRTALLENDIHHLPLWVALDEGYFKEEGVDIDIVGLFRAGPEIMSAFSAGAVDMAYVGEAPTVTAFANGTAKIKILAQVNTEGSAIVVSRNSTIKSVRDLRTKVVAIPGYSTVQDCLLHKALGKYHISLKDVQITVIRPPEMISALRMGQIDAFVAWEPVPSQAIGMGVGDILATSGSIWPDHPCCVLVVDAILAKKHPDKLRRILRAHQKAVAFILSKPREAAVIAVKHTGMSAQVVKMAMENVKYVSDLNIEGLRDYIKYLKRLGYVDVKDVEALIAHLVNRPEE